MLGVLCRLFKIAWYLLWLPVHIVTVFVTCIIACTLMVLDIPLWVLFGKYGILSDLPLAWHHFHLDKLFGD
ncbi:hypothetical protein SIPHO075v1_p0013 [Vibrio phage PS65A.1]|nr:hypothetical protein SIPHO075v1_p0013 [Vibrio phage PS65A.1]